MILSEAEKFDELAAIRPQVGVEKLWQLTALARTNLKEAGARLHNLVKDASPALPQLRVLAGYYGLINDKKQLAMITRLIVKRETKQIDRIKGLVEEAINEGKQSRALHLLKQLDAFHPEDNYDLKLLRRKVNNLHINGEVKTA